MRLSERQVEILAFRIVKALVEEKLAEVTSREVVEEHVKNLVVEDLSVEDKLNEEVREILSQYEGVMRAHDITYREMFNKVKRKLARERGLIL